MQAAVANASRRRARTVVAKSRGRRGAGGLLGSSAELRPGGGRDPRTSGAVSRRRRSSTWPRRSSGCSGRRPRRSPTHRGTSPWHTRPKQTSIRRERAWLRALESWHAKSFDAAAAAFENITQSFAGDLLALRAAEFLYYVLGQQHSGPRFLAHTERMAELPPRGSRLSRDARVRERAVRPHGSRPDARRALAPAAGAKPVGAARARSRHAVGRRFGVGGLLDGRLAQAMALRRSHDSLPQRLAASSP